MTTQHVLGLDELAVKLAKLGGIGSVMTRHVETAMLRVEGDAKRLCPVAKVEGSNLRNSIERATLKSTPEEVTVAVHTPVEYAEFVEYGTGRRGAASGVTPPSDYKYGPKPGMKAQPYLRPAMDANEADVIDDIRRAVKQECARI